MFGRTDTKRHKREAARKNNKNGQNIHSMAKNREKEKEKNLQATAILHIYLTG